MHGCWLQDVEGLFAAVGAFCVHMVCCTRELRHTFVESKSYAFFYDGSGSEAQATVKE